MRSWETPLGSFVLEIGEHGIRSVRWANENGKVQQNGQAQQNGKVAEAVNAELAASLYEHLHGRPSSLRLDLAGLRPLALMTLGKLLEIPFGEVRSYAWVAREIEKPAAVRAVASAVAGNPIPLLIPCHRVVRSDGFIGEFSLGGPEMKRKLLTFEGLDVDNVETLARRGIRFLGDKEAGIFHLPTCKLTRNSDTSVAIEFHSLDDAQQGGLYPCKRCRPRALLQESESESALES